MDEHGCEKSITFEILNYGEPIINFHTNSYLVRPNIPIYFYDSTIVAQGTSIIEYNWYVDGVLISDNIHFIHEFSDTGNYTVMLEILSSIGCFDTISKILRLNIPLKVALDIFFGTSMIFLP